MEQPATVRCTLYIVFLPQVEEFPLFSSRSVESVVPDWGGEHHHRQQGDWGGGKGGGGESRRGFSLSPLPRPQFLRCIALNVLQQMSTKRRKLNLYQDLRNSIEKFLLTSALQPELAAAAGLDGGGGGAKFL